MPDPNDLDRSAAGLAARRPTDHSNDALALDFADRHEGELCYCARTKRWYVFDCGRWHIDTTDLVIDLARAVCRRRAAELRRRWPDDPTAYRVIHSVLSAKTIAAVERLARSDRRLAVAAAPGDGRAKGHP